MNKCMRKITEIIVHCSATAAGRDFGAADIDRWHKARGFKGIGYHYVVRLDGRVEPGRAESHQGAHCLGHNAHSIGVCYIGGLAADGKTPADTRTAAQKASLSRLIKMLRERYPGAEVHGHREFAAKACPCFDARREYLSGLLGVVVCLGLLLASCSTSRQAVREEAREEVTEMSVCEAVREMELDSVIKSIDVRADSVVAEYEGGSPVPRRVRLYGVDGRGRGSAGKVKVSEETEKTRSLESSMRRETERKPGGGFPVWPVALAGGVLLGLLSGFRIR